MDSPNNLVLTIIKGDREINTVIPISSSTPNGVLFTIHEYDEACLYNGSFHFDCFIEDLDKGGEKMISCEQSVPINDATNPNPPMEYRLRLVDKASGASKSYLYRIDHTNVTDENQYKTMVETIASYDENLLYEQEAKYLNAKRIANSSSKGAYALLKRLALDKRFILASLSSISSEPLSILMREVAKTKVVGRQSPRSMVKNDRSFREGDCYSSKISVRSDIPLNEYLVYMLHFVRTVLPSLRDEGDKMLKHARSRLERINSSASKDPSRRTKNTLSQICKLNEKRQTLLSSFEAIDSILASIRRLLSSPTFYTIPPLSHRDESIILHPQYRNIERRLFLPLRQGRSLSYSSAYNSVLASPFKQTSLLFESYCLFAIDSAITELGFEPIDDEVDYEHFVKRFAKDQYEFELFYSIDAKDVSKAKQGEFYTLHKTARHMTPDFYLLLKKQNVPVCFLILEAKCRKTARVAFDIEEGKYEDSIRDYLSIRYAPNENPFVSPKIVDSLWLLFPDDGVAASYTNKNNLEYHFVKLSLDGDEQDFMDRFVEFMSSYIDG